ncbi:MAG: hypothetical protein SPI74_00605 [Eubacterium sp.]|nr:hypothetical protein [Eubacterium sp.]
MTNFQNYILASLTTQAMTFNDDDRVNCLINHYEENIELYENVVAQGLVHSPAEIVDTDYYNIDLIFFDKDDNVDMKKIEEVREYFPADEIYFATDSANGDKYLYSLTLPITKNFTKDELLAREIEEAEEFEF